MRFLVDECTGPKVAAWLRSMEHEVFSAYEESPGLLDGELLAKATAENWVLITNDKDFGELIYREKQPHSGVILLRLNDERATSKIAALEVLLKDYADQLVNQFVVLTASHGFVQVRIAAK